MSASEGTSVRLASFAVVGMLGFLVDATILSTLVHIFDWSHYSGRAVSFTSAVSVTWLCNRRWVFGRTDHPQREYGAYFLAQAIGAAINLGTYSMLIELAPALARLPVVPLAGGAALALLFNYLAASRWVFANGRAAGQPAE